MKRQKIIMTNNFHNTEVAVLAGVMPYGHYLSAGQVKRAKKVLCGIGGCTCGDCAGTRPGQVSLELPDGGALIHN